METFWDDAGNLPTQDQFIARMKQLKIGKKDTVICYETSATDGKQNLFLWQARAAWVLSTYGIENVFILDGAYPRWEEQNRHPEPPGFERKEVGSKDYDYVLDVNKIKYLKDI